MIRVQIKFPAHGVWWGASGAEAGKLARPADLFQAVSILERYCSLPAAAARARPPECGETLVVRPLTGMIGFIGWKRPRREKLILAFFGIRGVGSFYYLAYGLNAAPFEGGDRLWAIVSLICLMSILLHGITVTPVMRWFDRSQGRDPDAEAAGAQAEASGRGASA